MHRWNDERGGVLLNVLMISMLLAAVIPLVLTLTTHAALSDQTMRNQKLASHLAIGAMETFVRYLDHYDESAGLERNAFLNAYNGFVADKRFVTPDGIPVVYSLIRNAAGEDVYTVTSRATAGSGRAARTEQLVYQFNASMGTAVIEIVDDPADRVVVPIGAGVIVQEGNDAVNVPGAVKMVDLEQVIGKKITDLADGADAYIASLEADPSVEPCACATFGAIQNAINGSAQAEPIIRVTGPMGMVSNYSGTWGSPAKPVTVMIDGNVNVQNDLRITVYGQVIFKGDVRAGKLELNVRSVNGQYGSLYMMRTLSNVQNEITIHVAETFHARALDLGNNTTIAAKKMVVEGLLKNKNNLNLAIQTDLLAGEIYMENNAQLTATAGDVLVSGNFRADNNYHITTGGLVAVGGHMTMRNPHGTISTGGATTSLIIPEDGGGGPGSGTGGGTAPGWQPVRL